MPIIDISPDKKPGIGLGWNQVSIRKVSQNHGDSFTIFTYFMDSKSNEIRSVLNIYDEKFKELLKAIGINETKFDTDIMIDQKLKILVKDRHANSSSYRPEIIEYSAD